MQASPNYSYADYEFTKIAEPVLRLVSCAIVDDYGTKGDIWLDKAEMNKEHLRNYYRNLPRGTILVAFAAEAEARSMIDLGINPLDFEWVDLMLEFMMLMNHCNKYGYGEHYVDGRVVYLKPFKDKKPNASLATALYKMLKIKVDTDRKTVMRDLIISGPETFSSEEQSEILAYGSSDVEHLPALRRAIWEAYSAVLPRKGITTVLDEAKRRARYAVRTAYMVKRGYPIDVEWARNLSGSTGTLIDFLIRDINSQFRGDDNFQPFYWNKKESRWSMDQANVKAWIRATGNDKGWELTKGGKDGLKKDLSLSAECFEDRFSYQHTYPRGNYGAQLVRYFKLTQSLNGFKKSDNEIKGKLLTGSKKKRKFWDYVGSDNHVRPYYGIYVAQSSRSQPSATGYIMLKPAWQRSLIKPPPGKMIIGCDYSSQEFLLSALFSKDKKMLAAYRSGDVYLAFGKDVGMIPKDGTKAQYKFERDACKATVLGLSYLMTKYGLARKLTADTGRTWTEDQAQELVDKFDRAYPEFSYWRREQIAEYRSRGYLQLRDGWYMFGDNHNDRSVANCPLQGSGGDIMRRAVEINEEDLIPINMTLHDALYAIVDYGDWDAVRRFNINMREAFIGYFPEQRENASMIRTDIYGWGPDFDSDQEIEIEGCGKVFFSNIYIDERAADEFDKFKGYFSTVPGSQVL